ncbi:hypothetical protein T484DRAFT_1922093 [Baffinella frigidus]|nr:hypothetical protein T484DRAFT_1922093 [Cryptophyta sp. CCMP2293]|mmetsp:Transcript_967/g.2355  ORF Transcript_967/g.2355 Transcript_967/m.2355 type:complete len:152 (-) Transcript_967:98-553(-)
MAPSEEPATIPGAGHASVIMPFSPPASPSVERARKKLVRYRRRNAMKEGSVEAIACLVAAMEYTEVDPRMAQFRMSATHPDGGEGNPRLGKRGSAESIDSRDNKTATRGNGAGCRSDEAITVHGDGAEPGSPPSVIQGFFTSIVQPCDCPA